MDSVYNSLSRFVQNTGELLGQRAKSAVSGIVQSTVSSRILDFSRKVSIAILLVATGVEVIQQCSGEMQSSVGGRIGCESSLRAAPYLIALKVSELFNRLTNWAIPGNLAQFEEGQVIPGPELDQELAAPVSAGLQRDARLDRALALFAREQAEEQSEEAERFLQRDKRVGYFVLNGSKLEFKPPVNL